MLTVGALSALGIYYLNKLEFDPTVLGILVAAVLGIEKIAYNWIRYNFKLPTTDTVDPEPVAVGAEPVVLTPANHVREAIKILNENIPKVEPPIDGP
jgi:hypothetical protein